MQFSLKLKVFYQFFFVFSKCRLNLEHFEKKNLPSKLMYFRNYGLQKSWLDKRLKSTVSEDPSTSNLLNGHKHF